MSKTMTAYLSARVPERLRNEFKSLAARRGMKLQDLLQEVVEDYIKREDIEPPSAGTIIQCLRRNQKELEEAGIRHLILFGSVARGDAMPTSDVDLAAEFAGNRTPGLVRIGRLADRIREILGDQYDIDLVPLHKMRGSVSDTALADAIGIF